ncbi:MAG: tRNA (N6-threonylcarbamoyladenosine(37)-N6)-methyltransferase TrmO [Thermoplasmata archaeon]|nr:MAG: tRNA (N6-threonylcarbamoyladenosine(37)-N6)-methyltransferase TrmO [Thermoplasmata archaeon]RLF26515.1 MAG: tRNA (N6-threonylcarbamoyladenosine(37)-N6)-methyltransferase TrmO [Thermoplasmata archaeon]
MSEIRYKPIGVIHSPFKKPSGVPIQPTAAEGVKGSIEVFPEYADGLKDLDGFSHIILVYHFHLSKKPLLMVRPYMDEELHGVFATRAPSRPNPIGISTLHLLRVEKNMLHVEDLDIVDGTPVLDIKPFVPEFDVRKTSRVGWLEKNLHKLSSVRDDGRFLE